MLSEFTQDGCLCGMSLQVSTGRVGWLVILKNYGHIATTSTPLKFNIVSSPGTDIIPKGKFYNQPFL